jgi:hypothetical protein
MEAWVGFPVVDGLPHPNGLPIMIEDREVRVMLWLRHAAAVASWYWEMKIWMFKLFTQHLSGACRKSLWSAPQVELGFGRQLMFYEGHTNNIRGVYFQLVWSQKPAGRNMGQNSQELPLGWETHTPRKAIAGPPQNTLARGLLGIHIVPLVVPSEQSRRIFDYLIEPTSGLLRLLIQQEAKTTVMTSEQKSMRKCQSLSRLINNDSYGY